MDAFASEYMAEPPAGQGRFDAGTVTSRVLTLGGALTSFSIVFVGMRAFTRVSLTKKAFGLDDYLIGISLGLAIIFFGLSVKLCELGVGVHLWQVKRADFSPGFLLHTFIAILIYSLSVTTAKLSLLFLYLRLSPERWFRIVTMAFISFATTYALIYLLLIIFSCRPIQASWDLSARAGATCVNKGVIYLALSGTNIVMDIVCLVLPLKIIIPLQMARRQKLSLILLFATGGLVCICAIRRTTILPLLLKSKDFTFDLQKQLNWASVEVNAGVMCASIPALKPFFIHYLPMFVTSRMGCSKCKGLNPNSRGYQTTNPYITRVANLKKPRTVQSEAYRLHSHDDVLFSSKEVPRDGEDEDVVGPWFGNEFRRDCTGRRMTIISSNLRDEDRCSVHSEATVQSGAGGSYRQTPAQRVASMCIRVTTETRVEYERS
ncbi:integral membrane protein [Colletotrichum somersetense]|nr:integral membrane protein [Colletotrichum somersetense]